LQSSHSMFFQESVLHESEVCLIWILLASQNCRHFTWIYFIVPEHLQGFMKGLSSSEGLSLAFSKFMQFFTLPCGVLLLSDRQILHCFTTFSSSSLSPWSVKVCLSTCVDFLEILKFDTFSTCLLSRKMSRTLNVILPNLRKSLGNSWKP